MKQTLVNKNGRHSLWDFMSEMDNFFGNSYSNSNLSEYGSSFQPAVNILEEEEYFLISADLPGLEKDQINIDFTDGILSLSGERKEEKTTGEKNFRRVEKRYGKFVRSFRMPDNIKTEQIDASFSDGVLEIRIPKSEKAKPLKIEVKHKQ